MSVGQGNPADIVHPTAGRPATPPRPAALASAPDALTLFRCLRRCWGRALTVGLVLAGASAALAWHVIPPSKHLARTLIHVPASKPTVLPSSERTPVLADHQRNQIALAKSRLVLNAALKRPGISELGIIRSQANALEWLERAIQVDFTVAPEVIRIAVSGDNPDELAKLVAALRDAYRSEILNKDRSERMEKLNTLAKQRQVYSDQLRAKLETQHQLEVQGGIKDPNTRGVFQSFENMRISWYERDLVQTEGELNKARVELAVQQSMARDSAKAGVPEAEIQAALNKDLSVLKSLDAVKEVKDKIAAFAAKSAKGEADPLLNSDRKRLAELQQAVEKAKQERSAEIADSLRAARRGTAAEAVHQWEVRVETLAGSAKSLREQLDQLYRARQKMNENNVQLDSDHDTTARLEWLVKQMADEEAKTQVAIDTTPVGFEVIEDATVIGAADDKRRLAGTAGAFAGILGLLLFAFAYYEFQSRRVASVDEIVHGLGLNLVGAIPASTGRATAVRESTPGDIPVHSTLAEAVDATRVVLLRAARSESLRVVMITSANGGEG
ncbi:MAG TPA: hypothetical protein VH120_13210, partial [Gemmataceae bacterium]|nr:hypothetical protein [Gemmataceae bacterium]